MALEQPVFDITKPSVAVIDEALKMDPASFSPSQIRNVCILAHVDHGKTCIADCLLTLNGIVNKRCTGKTKYLDDRPDEQDRKITMKSSAVSICHTVTDSKGKKIPQLINLVDTPGHIDFSTEVTSAVRICDGALCVVDVVEGMLPQTKIALKEAYDEHLNMILVINKIDRLIIDLQLELSDMFYKIWYVVQDCNDYIRALMRSDITSQTQDSSNIEGYFNPVIGNVIFCSAIDGWGFTLEQIAEMYLPLLQEETPETLTQKLWELDLFVSSKDKCIKSGAVEKRMPNVFCQLVCSMLIHIYNTLVVKEDHDGIPKILQNSKLTKPHFH